MSAFNVQFFASSLMLLSLSLSLSLQLLLLSTVEGFQNHRVYDLSSSMTMTTTTTTTIRGDTRMYNSNNANDDDNNESSSSLPLSTPLSSPASSPMEQGTFNPFDYQRNNKTSRSSNSAPPRVSLRSVRMSNLTNELLNSLGDENVMRTILEDNRDFLLEPLEEEGSMAVR